MRFSVDDTDAAGYANWLAFRPLRVLMDGKVLPRVRSVDTDAGEATVLATDEIGCIRIDRIKMVAITEQVRGAITIELIPQPIN